MPSPPRSLIPPVLGFLFGLALFAFFALRWIDQNPLVPDDPAPSAVSGEPGGGEREPAAKSVARPARPSEATGAGPLSVPVSAPPTTTAGAEASSGTAGAVGVIERGPERRPTLAGASAPSVKVAPPLIETEMMRQGRIWAEGARAGSRMKGQRVDREQMAADLHPNDWVGQVIFVAGFEWGSL